MNLLKRIIFGTLLIAVSVGVAWLDGWLSDGAPADGGLWRHGAVLTGVWSIVALLTVLELMALLAVAGQQSIRWLAVAGTLVLVLVPWWCGPHTGDPGRTLADLGFTVGTLVAVASIACIWIVFRGTVEGALAHLTSTLFVVSYVGLFLAFAVRLRMHYPGYLGVLCVFYYLMITKSADIGAFFVGTAIGKHKLIPSLSPKKSVEGLAGGIVFSIAVAFALHAWLLAPQFARAGLPSLPAWLIVLFAVVMTLGGLLGDLVESAIKRSASLKDSSGLVPGFGGFFDVSDSFIFTAPAAWLLLTWRPLSG